MLPPIAPFLDSKHVLRMKMRGERRAAARARPDAARFAAHNFLTAIDAAQDAAVALYHPIKDELDTAPLADALIEKGARLALPAVAQKRAPLVFRAWRPGDDLVKGGFGALTPDETAPALRPDIVVAPLLAFTRAGGRLGYGGGFYDRTLADLRAAGDILAVGYAYAAQEVDALPLTPLDQPLDWIVTEGAAIRC